VRKGIFGWTLAVRIVTREDFEHDAQADKVCREGPYHRAGAAWFVFDKFNQIGQNPGFTPKWSDKPLLKSWEKTKPPLGWPRETDSLCPRCVPEIRQQILERQSPPRSPVHGQTG